MGILFAASGAGSQARPNEVSDEFLHRMQCKVCPLHKEEKHLRNPKMPASGSKEPLIYVLGEAPDEAADDEGKQSVGVAGDYVRPFIPSDLRKAVRWNNTIRCHPKGNRDPDKTETECCRPSVAADIEAAAPDAIFGLGSFALSWAGITGEIGMWRGRRLPVRIGSHECWFYPMFHPSFLLHMKGQQRNRKSDFEVAFEFDIRRAFEEVKAGLPQPVIHTAKDARSAITCIEGRASGDLAYVIDFLEYAGTCDVAGVDYETQNIRPYRKDSVILTKAVSVHDETVAFAWRHQEAGWTEAQFEKLTAAYIRFLKSKAKKAAHQLSFEMEWSCYNYGNELAREVPWEDPMTQAYVLDERVGERKPGAQGLEFLVQQYCGLNVKKLTVGLNKKNMAREPLSRILPYNGMDSKYHRIIYVKQDKRLTAEGLQEVYREKLEQVPTVVLAQLKGIPIDQEVNQELSRLYGNRIAKIEREIAALPEAAQYRKFTGQQFNPGSPQDVIILLRDILKTREGQPGTGWSTNEKVLSEIKNPITNGVVAYRKAVKLKGTYVDPYSEGSDTLYVDGKIHTNFGTTFTDTGRLQSEDPNVQNLPNRSEEARLVRRQFRKKRAIVASFDYGQIDARGIACGSRDRHYCKALFEDYDIHMEWAKRLALHHPDWVGGSKYVHDEKVLKKFRATKTKNDFVFASFYGAALRTTAARFGVDEDVMRPMYEGFWKQFAGVKDWQDTVVKQFDELGYVQLFGGLRRRAPIGRGQIINSPIQGATNRITMHAMNRLSKMGDLYQAVLQIHDDLTFMFDSENDFYDAAPTIVDTMLDGRVFDWICVPLVVEIKFGESWADQVDGGSFRSDHRLGWPIREKAFM